MPGVRRTTRAPITAATAMGLALDSAVMRDSWQWRIERASELAAREESTQPLIEVYGRLLALQRECFERLAIQVARLSGSLERDLVAVVSCVPRILEQVTAMGPPPLAEDARQLMDSGNPAIEAMLLAGWRTPSDEQ